MSARRFRFERRDFTPLPVTLRHADIALSFFDDRVEGHIALRMEARRPLTELELDARELDIRAVSWRTPEGSRGDAPYRYDRDASRLVVTLPRPAAAGDCFTIEAAATSRPSDSVLEGIYRDTTPPGCPPQYMSQCQQWGFQRILPILDDCTAKCTMTVTLEGDARYTHLIANGNICRRGNPDGRPVPKADDPSRQVIRFENPVPMAPYLFIACAGTWDVLADHVDYPSGRRVRLEYLVPPGRTADARIPMEILKDSIRWQGRTQGYEYPFEVYRTICMEKSNFGGMENVGNTTIVTSAALIDDFIGDRRLEYAHGVIVHEFEHNQCGSDVTMETPFDMWLNEAFTVDVERQYLRSQFDPDGVRIDEVDDVRAPLVGPLAVEDGGHMGNIVREGFNDPDELVDGVTYVKAAEVIRMLRAIIGDDAFRRGKELYFARYRGGNANTEQFFACFEASSGRELGAFKREWLYTIGYPRITATHAYDAGARRLTLNFVQTRAGTGGLFHVPIAMAAVDAGGRDIAGTARVVELTGAETTITLDEVPRPAFLSLNRDYSFYGTFEDASATPESLRAQMRLDGNAFNRVEAMRRLTERERCRLLHDPAAPIGEAWLDAMGDIVADRSLSPGLKARFLRIDEQSLDRQYVPWYRERWAARSRLMRAVAERHGEELRAAFEALDTITRPPSPKDGIDERRLKAALLRLMIEADTDDVQQLAETHFRRAWNFSDRLAALHAVVISSHPRRRAVMEEAFEEWRGHLNGYTGYLALVGADTHEEAFERIAEEAARPLFRVDHPSHNRALYLPMAANNKLLWTDRGLAWLRDAVVQLAPVNENTAIRLAAALNQVHRLAADIKPPALEALRGMAAAIDPARCPSAAGRVRAYLEGADA